MFKYILIIALLTITATCVDPTWRVIPAKQYDTSPGLINARNYGLNNIIAQLFAQNKVPSTSGWKVAVNNSISTYNTTTTLWYMFNLTLSRTTGDLLYANFTIYVNRRTTANFLVFNSTLVNLKSATTTPVADPSGYVPGPPVYVPGVSYTKSMFPGTYYCNITLYGSNTTTVNGKSVTTPIVKNYQLTNKVTQIWEKNAKAVMQTLDHFTYAGTLCEFKALFWHTLNFNGGFQVNIVTTGNQRAISSTYKTTTLSYKFHIPIPGDKNFSL